MERHWTPTDLVCEVTLPLDRVALAEEAGMAAG
jgi:hypothetical protein